MRQLNKIRSVFIGLLALRLVVGFSLGVLAFTNGIDAASHHAVDLAVTSYSDGAATLATPNEVELSVRLALLKHQPNKNAPSDTWISGFSIVPKSEYPLVSVVLGDFSSKDISFPFHAFW